MREDTVSPPAPAGGSPEKPWRLKQYEMKTLLGEGGMGRVYKAYDHALNRHVAIKVLKEADPSLSLRFTREAMAQAQVEHERVCKVYEAGTEDGRPYIVMQLIEGATLDAVYREMPVEQRVRVIMQVAEAVHAAHSVGLIHRDIKPGNIMMERAADGGWKPYVMDFGLAREQSTRGLTTTGVVIGTVEYMSPEQLRLEYDRLDRRSDVYSLGVVLYELLTGQRPFQGPTALEIMARILHDEPRSLRHWLRSIPHDLDIIVLKCLDKDPARRYDSARALADDLRRYLEGLPILARPASLVYRLSRKARRHGVALGVGVAALVVCAALLTMWLRERWTATRHAELAQRFGQEVEAVETLLWKARVLPRHDITAQKDVVRQRMAEIQKRAEEIGDLAAGPAHYAQGRGHLALLEFDQARTHLETAWAAGNRTPDVAYALGLAMGMLYQQELESLNGMEDGELRRARRQKIDLEFRQPVLDWLGRARGVQVDAPEYVQGLVAFYDGRHADALRLARAAFAKCPWLYEARMLEGDIESAQGDAMSDRGEVAGAATAYDGAEGAYQAALRIAQSDPRGYRGLGELWLRRLDMGLDMDREDLRREFQSAMDQFDSAVQVDPQNAAAHIQKCRLLTIWAEHLKNKGENPEASIESAIRSANTALRIRPDDAEAHRYAGEACLSLADYEARHGIDPVASLERAAWNFERSNAVQPSCFVYNSLGTVYRRRAAYDMAQGRAPDEALARAAGYYQKAISINPQLAGPYGNLGYLHDTRGKCLKNRGENPAEAFRESTRWFEKAIEINSSDPIYRNNQGITFTDIGVMEMERGADPHRSLEQAARCFQKAIELKPAYAFAYNNLGYVWLRLAEYESMHGADPRPSLEHAVGALSRAIEVRPGYATPFFNLELVYLAQGVHERALGVDPMDSFKKARDRLEAGLAIQSDSAEAYAVCALVRLHEARWSSDNQRSPLPTLSDVRAYLRRSLALDPTYCMALQTGAEADLVEAQWRIRREQNPEDVLGRSREVLQKALDTNANDINNYRIAAEISYWAGVWKAQRAIPAEEDVREGLAASERALGIDPTRADVLALQGRLELLRARSSTDAATRATAARRAMEQFERAFAINPKLRREHDREYAGASKLLGPATP